MLLLVAPVLLLLLKLSRTIHPLCCLALQDLVRELGSNPQSRSRLMPALMRLFCRPQLWAPASNFFSVLAEGKGARSMPAPHVLTHAAD